MVLFTKEIGIKIINMGKVFKLIKMENNMMVIGSKAKEMVKESING